MRLIIVSVLVTLLLVTPAAAGGFVVSIDDQSVTTGSKGDIPVLIANPEELGEMSLEISFNPYVLRFSSLILGDISKNGIIEATEEKPGTIVVHFTDDKGVSRDGVLFKLTFDVTGLQGSSSPVTVTSRGVYNLDLKEVPVEVHPGMITVMGSVSPGNGAKTPVSPAIPIFTLMFMVGMANRMRNR